MPTREGAFGKWTCLNCNEKQSGDIDPYAARLIDTYLLVRGGYPFSKDDLDPRDRRLLGLVDVIVNRIENREALSLYLSSIIGKNE